jgi:hypothetical protein
MEKSLTLANLRTGTRYQSQMRQPEQSPVRKINNVLTLKEYRKRCELANRKGM